MKTDETIMVQVTVPATRLYNAEQILAKIGLKPSDAINIFFAKIELCQGIPFALSLDENTLLTADQQATEWSEAFGNY